MDILLSFSNGIGQIAFAVIGFILIMSLVVFVHEYGHFSVARLCGVTVTDFSIGFGKKILSRKDKHGTLWSLSLIPMGGYVKFLGDKSAGSHEDLQKLNNLSDSEKKQSFYFKSIPQKIAIILAGPLANILLCVFLLFFINFFLGIQTNQPIIKNVNADSAAYRNGLQDGDRFVTINGHNIQTAQEVKKEVSASFGDPIELTISRDNEQVALLLTPDMVAVAGETEKIPVMGVIFSDAPEHIIISNYNFTEALKKSYQDTVFLARLTGIFFQRVFTGKAGADTLSGPIRISDAAGTALQSGVWSFLLLMALISMSIGLVNLLPVPMLDGGHLVFYLLEAVGLKANPRVREIAFKMGFVLVVSLMVFTVINDIITIGAR